MRARFSAPVQTVREDHPGCYIMETASFPVLKRQGCGVDHPPPSGAEVKEYGSTCILSLGLCGLLWGEL